MNRFASICFGVCIVSIAGWLVIALTILWAGITDVLVWKMLGTATACFFASGIACAITRDFLKPPRHTMENGQRLMANNTSDGIRQPADGFPKPSR